MLVFIFIASAEELSPEIDFSNSRNTSPVARNLGLEISICWLRFFINHFQRSHVKNLGTGWIYYRNIMEEIDNCFVYLKFTWIHFKWWRKKQLKLIQMINKWFVFPVIKVQFVSTLLIVLTFKNIQTPTNSLLILMIFIQNVYSIILEK